MIYLYRCPVCASRREVVKPLADIDRPELCGQCGNLMNRQICAPAVMGDLPGYDCPITGQWIEGRKAHEENLRKHGCRVLESGEREAVFRRREQEERDFDKVLDEEVGTAIANLPHEKRQQLETEVGHGFGLDVSRSTWTPGA